MTLFEIDQKILDCIDMETGEVIDFEALEALQMTRTEKFEGICLAVKTLSAEVDALDAIEKDYKERKTAKKNKLEGLKGWLKENGESFETDRVRMTLGKKPIAKLEYDKDNKDELIKTLTASEHFGCLKTEVKISDSAVKDLLLKGTEIPGFSLSYSRSLTIK